MPKTSKPTRSASSISSSKFCIRSTGLRLRPVVGSEMTAPKLSTPICIFATPEIPDRLDEESCVGSRSLPHSSVLVRGVPRTEPFQHLHLLARIIENIGYLVDAMAGLRRVLRPARGSMRRLKAASRGDRAAYIEVVTEKYAASPLPVNSQESVEALYRT